MQFTRTEPIDRGDSQYHIPELPSILYKQSTLSHDRPCRQLLIGCKLLRIYFTSELEPKRFSVHGKRAGSNRRQRAEDIKFYRVSHTNRHSFPTFFIKSLSKTDSNASQIGFIAYFIGGYTTFDGAKGI